MKHLIIPSLLRIQSQSVKNVRKFSSVASAPKPGVDWESMSFSLTPTDYMYISTCKEGETFKKGNILPYGPLQLYPSASVLNYGQGLFEGIKAFRTEKNRVVIFRPQENGIRMNAGARRFLMPEVPSDVFLDGLSDVVRKNSHWIPPSGKGALYLRPTLFGSGAGLGVRPSKEYTFSIFVSPVGNYFKGGKASPINLFVTDAHRAAPRGSGDVKAIGNYAPAFAAQKKAKEDGFSEVLFLDAKYDKYIEEAGASNIFCFKGDTLYTPELGSILAGITRLSVIQLAKANNIKVVEEKLDIEKVMTADEVFCTGTGASITPVGSITFKSKKKVYNNGEVGKIAQHFYDTLLGIQFERTPDKYNWLYDPFAKK